MISIDPEARQQAQTIKVPKHIDIQSRCANGRKLPRAEAPWLSVALIRSGTKSETIMDLQASLHTQTIRRGSSLA
jgi:hypothetical protein